MNKYNVLLINCHDLGRFLGCYGIDTVQTPNIDALADDGVCFTNAYCVAPQCSPSRASLFTGRYPHNNGMMGLTNLGEWNLDPQEEHLAQRLKSAADYNTAVTGVFHESAFDPLQHHHMDAAFTGIHRGEAVTEKALELLSDYAKNENPFYLQVGYYEPHRIRTMNSNETNHMGFIGDYIDPDAERGVTIPPYLCDDETAREELAELQGAVRYLDTQVGRLLQELREQGLEKNTLVIFTTDHGIALPRAKCSMYDPGLEVSLIMRLPDRGWNGGKRISHLISNIDIFPTVTEILGVSGDGKVQGQSFAGVLDEESYSPRDCIFGEMTYHEYYDPRRCIRTQSYKLIVNFSASPSFMDPSQSWRRRTSTVVPAKPPLAYHSHIELYNLESDPAEQKNVADVADYAAVRDELLGRLLQWMEDTDDPVLKGAVVSPFHRNTFALLQEAKKRVGLKGGHHK